MYEPTNLMLYHQAQSITYQFLRGIFVMTNSKAFILILRERLRSLLRQHKKGFTVYRKTTY